MSLATKRRCALVLSAAAVAVLVLPGCGGGTDPGAPVAPARSADAVEGSWISTVTIRDCTSGSAVGGFRSVITFHPGGILSETRDGVPGFHDAGQGHWTRGVGDTYAAAVRFDRSEQDGIPARNHRVFRAITLAADRATLSGTIAAQVWGGDAGVLQTLCGTERSARLPESRESSHPQ